MVVLDSTVAHLFGVHREAGAALLARALLRMGLACNYDSQLTPGAAQWFAQVANELGTCAWGSSRAPPAVSVSERVEWATREALRELKRADAPAILAALAPRQRVPACDAKDLAKACRALIARHLPSLCRAVLDEWVEQRVLIDTDRADVEEPPEEEW